MNAILRDIAYARSGDKGSNANIGVIAYTAEGYEFLKTNLTDKKVNDYFAHLGVKETVRYELPNLLGMNFLLKEVLSGGASESLRIDLQGKTLGQTLLNMPIQISEEVLAKSKKRS